MKSVSDNSTPVAARYSEKSFRTGAWRGEPKLDLNFPANWDMTVWWPLTPPPLTDREIAQSLDRPVGQSPIRETCRGKSRPLMIVDDLNRPTPADRVIPLLLERFRETGIPAEAVTILVSTGTHGAPRADAVRLKVGPEAASACQVLIHDPNRNCVSLGRTSSGTPVIVNSAVLASDFVIGIGGVYPNQAAGYGGGSKLALGVLGLRTIKTLHFRYRAIGWGRWAPDAPFRRDLNEIASMIQLRTAVSLQINAEREVIRVTCGDHFRYYDDEVAFAKRCFSAPTPEEADLVISNSYPNDLSLTAALQKGSAPLRQTRPGASRILIASCLDGIGHHGLFPVANRPPHFRALQVARTLCAMKPREVAEAVVRRLRRKPALKPVEENRTAWLYTPVGRPDLPSVIPGYRVCGSWAEISRGVEAEQGFGKRLKVFCYPCAPLQNFVKKEA